MFEAVRSLKVMGLAPPPMRSRNLRQNASVPKFRSMVP
jgi:hypothetical protein